jgi:hypothetical protein
MRRKAHSNTFSNQENIYQKNLRQQRSGSERHPSSIKKARRASRSVDPTSQSVGQRAKKKFKQIQTKKANDRLARLEKMYQELT